MNEYSVLQKFLHRASLSKNFFREASFELEQLLFGKRSTPSDGNHVFVAGLARAGTTILLRAIHKSNEFASLSYSDMPFVLAPNLWKKLNPRKQHSGAKERAHGDGILVTTSSPEAFEEVFWNTFSEPESSEKFPSYVNVILKRYGKQRYLSKNNQNVRRIERIVGIFPGCTILIPFRDPLQHAFSLLNQHSRFCELQEEDQFIKNYMDWIGHSEFGLSYRPIITESIKRSDYFTLDHWLEQWYLVYSFLWNDFCHLDNVALVCYEGLCNRQTEWERIMTRIGIDRKYGFNFKQSPKEIDVQFDPALHGQCNNLYQELRAACV